LRIRAYKRTKLPAQERLRFVEIVVVDDTLPEHGTGNGQRCLIFFLAVKLLWRHSGHLQTSRRLRTEYRSIYGLFCRRIPVRNERRYGDLFHVLAAHQRGCSTTVYGIRMSRTSFSPRREAFLLAAFRIGDRNF
jgi:hypothetical protein